MSFFMNCFSKLRSDVERSVFDTTNLQFNLEKKFNESNY